MIPLEHFSATSLSMFQRCPEQFRHRYILGEIQPPGSALILGGAFHTANEYTFIYKMDVGNLPNVNDVLDAYNEGWNAAIDEKGGPSEIEWSKPARTEKATGAKLVEKYYHTVAPRIHPVRVEHEFSRIVPGVDIPLTGKIDLETPDTITDYKTANSYRGKKRDWNLQERIYQSEIPKDFHWHIADKKTGEIKTPFTHITLESEYDSRIAKTTDKLILMLVRQIENLMETYGPDNPWPGNITHDWACGYCGFRNRGCPYW